MTTLTREKIEALREAARAANADTDYIPPVMMRCDPDTILSLCDMAEASLRSQSPEPSSSEPVATLGQAYADLAAAQTDTDADIAEASSRNRSALYATFGPTPSQPVTGEEVRRLRLANERWRQNSIDTWAAMTTMRNSINERIPMPSLEGDLLQGPESSVFCAAVAEAVLSYVDDAEARLSDYQALKAERDEARAICDCTDAQLMDYAVRLSAVEGALKWYGEQARLCRLIHSEGDKGRNALAADGGKRARAALSKAQEDGE